MSGPLPKPARLRQRRNRVSTRAALPSIAQAAGNAVPQLPPRDRQSERWHPKVIAWWQSVWHSPMAGELLESDVKGGLLLIAELYQRRWAADTAKEIVALATEIRQQEARFGLSPVDRRRLQWEIERGQQADDRTARRRGLKAVEGKDPRTVLKVTK